MRKIAKNSWERVGLLFYYYELAIIGVPSTRQWTNPNYTERNACYLTESGLKHKSNGDYYAPI